MITKNGDERVKKSFHFRLMGRIASDESW